MGSINPASMFSLNLYRKEGLKSIINMNLLVSSVDLLVDPLLPSQVVVLVTHPLSLRSIHKLIIFKFISYQITFFFFFSGFWGFGVLGFWV